MTVLETVLPIVINILLCVFLTVGIILVIKCIYILDRTKKLIDNIENKVNSFNSLFKFIDIINSKISLVSEKISDVIEGLMFKIINKTNKKEEEIKTKKGKKKDE